MTRTLLRRLAREPLLHFVLMGAALFALERAFSGAEGQASTAPAPIPAPTTRLVVDAAVRAELEASFEGNKGRAPSEDELDDLIDGWIDRQILYREGLARGLDLGDERIAARVADKMAFVLRSQIVVREPADTELAAFFAAHADRYKQHALVDFVHVFVDGHDDAAKDRATELLAKLEEGANPGGLGDTFSGGRRYRQRKLEDLAERFGKEFATGVGVQDLDRWALQHSRFGWHVVRVEKRMAGRDRDLAQVKEQAIRDWQEEERAREMALAIEALRARWEIVQEP
jgi:hypothetical protein